MPATDQTSTVAAREDDATVARSESLQQMTQDERDAYLASVESARASQQSAGPGRQGVPASQLRNLARNHGEEALKEIEED